MNNEILELLKNTEEREGVEILYACESGSRAWGFASPNSDYDIRFLYRHPQEHYLSIFHHEETIEIPIENDLDPGGWDVRKALGLLAKSNGALIEWLHSPIVYLDKGGFCAAWRELTRSVMMPHHLVNHYRGLAMQINRKKLTAEAPTAKGYLYASRALLAARWVETHKTPPPVAFSELLELAPDLRERLEMLVAWKAEKDEVASAGRIPELDRFITEELLRKTERPSPEPPHIKTTLDNEFHRLLTCS